MKNIISYSLWGDDPIYWVGAIKNIELANIYYPNYIVRFYVDDTSDINLIKTLQGDNVEVILVKSEDSFHGMFWRFFASCEEDVNIFLSRDTDSRISKREVDAVNEWLESNKDFHIMRDHPYHGIPILGGMWGCRNGLMRKINLIDKIKEWNNYSSKGIDQDFLGNVVYPIIYTNCLEHSEFNIKFNNEIKTFPSNRINYEFIGEVYDENEQINLEHNLLIKYFLSNQI